MWFEDHLQSVVRIKRQANVFFAAALFLLIAAPFCMAQTVGQTPERTRAHTGLPTATPESVGMRADVLSEIDRIVQYGLKRDNMPGAVVLVARKGKIVFHKAYGNRRVKPSIEPMTTDTVFDMASITKPVATATSVMKLMEMGKIHPDDKVTKFIPEFAANGKGDVTILQLLTHQGGLIPDNSLKDYLDGPEKAFERIYGLKKYVEPGTKFVYTDVGFILLAHIVERVSGLNVHKFSQKHVFVPLKMTETGYLPADNLKQRSATTETRKAKGESKTHWMRGEVHDPRAYELGGIAGHAGLFSTATDLAVYGQMMISGGQYNGKRILKPETVATMTRAYPVSSGIRGLGWDKRTAYSSNRGDLLSDGAFGHGGFTGTVLWMDPKNELVFVFLSNRVHPNGKGSVNALAGRIVTVAAASIVNGPTVSRVGSAQSSAVRTGIDVLTQTQFAELKSQRIGLITNHTGLDRNGNSTVELLHNSNDVNLVALFSPEHGFAGKLDTAKIADATDSSTGLKVFSLYGKTRSPTAEMLNEIDTVVFDIQDIGTRFYTYISTMGNAMKAASKHGKRFVVLDRPNPIGGSIVNGPVLDSGAQSFVGYHTIAVRHGMTTGELARMFKSEMNLNLDLKVIQCTGWIREHLYDQTRLRWTNPSPNMRSLTQAITYPGIGLLETTNVSVGRGTDTPFEVLGAPWIVEREFCKSLNETNLPGVRFVPIRFRPDASKYKGEACGGVNIVVTNRAKFRPIETGLEIAIHLRKMYPKDWDTKSLNRLLNHQETHDAIISGRPFASIQQKWQPLLNKFKARRAKYLLY